MTEPFPEQASNQPSSPLIVGFGGTMRPGSTGERLTMAVLAECEILGMRTRLFGGAELAQLPHFAPDIIERTPQQIEFLSAVRDAAGLVIATPGYHGGVSGLVKNAIDLLEDTRCDARTYFDGMPVGLIVTAGGWQAGGVTLTAMRSIVHAMRGWPTPTGITVNTVAQRLFDEDGSVVESSVLAAIKVQAQQIARLAR